MARFMDKMSGTIGDAATLPDVLAVGQSASTQERPFFRDPVNASSISRQRFRRRPAAPVFLFPAYRRIGFSAGTTAWPASSRLTKTGTVSIGWKIIREGRVVAGTPKCG